MEKIKNRVSYIDIAKGIGIFFVIWGHIILSGPVYNFIYSFHMPLFFFLSGFVFCFNKYKNIREFTIRKIKTLLVPYFILSFFTYIYWVLIENRISNNQDNTLSSFIQIFLAQGSSGYMAHNIPMWFVPCLFLLEHIYFVLCKLNNKKIRVLIIFIFAIIGCYMTLENNIFRNSLWSAEIALVALPFYAIGNEISNKISFKEIENKILDNKKIFITICIVSFVALCFLSNLNPDISMGTDKLGNWFLFYFNAILGIVGTILISIFICKNKLLEFMGRKSFFIMATHFPVRKPIVLVFSILLSIESQIIYSNIFYSLIISIITLIIELIIIKILTYIKPLSKYLCI